MRLNDNKDVYTRDEFECTADRDDFLPEEEFLIMRFLDRHGTTLEAGTGGGRILLKMLERGFTSLRGFDIVPELIEHARKRDRSGTIQFEVQDATSLPYPSESFDQLVYLQQVTGFIEGDDNRRKAVAEAYRILKKGGVALFSFLSFEVRSRSLLYGPFVLFLRFWRRIRGRKRPIQSLPWLKLGGKFNWPGVLDVGPYVWWFYCQEAKDLLREAGFTVEGIGSGRQLRRGLIYTSCDQVIHEGFAGAHFFVCRK